MSGCNKVTHFQQEPNRVETITMPHISVIIKRLVCPDHVEWARSSVGTPLRFRIMCFGIVCLWVLLVVCVYSAYHFASVEQGLAQNLGYSPKLSLWMWACGILVSFGQCVILQIRQLLVIRTLLHIIDT